MKAKRTHDVVASVGTYKDRDGTEKKRYHKFATVFTDEEGRMSIKFDGFPIGPDWSGWASCFKIEPSDNKPKEPAAGRYENAQDMAAGVGSDEIIPF